MPRLSSIFPILVLVGACTLEPTEPIEPTLAIASGGGEGQTGTVGSTLPLPIVVQVTGINDAITAIARASDEGVGGLDAVSADLGRLGSQARDDVDLAEGLDRAGGDLHTVILELGQTIRQFHLRQPQAPARQVEASRQIQHAPAPASVAVRAAGYGG